MAQNARTLTPERYAYALQTLFPDQSREQYAKLVEDNFMRSSAAIIGRIEARATLDDPLPEDHQKAIATLREVDNLDEKTRAQVDSETKWIFEN